LEVEFIDNGMPPFRSLLGLVQGEIFSATDYYYDNYVVSFGYDASDNLDSVSATLDNVSNANGIDYRFGYATRLTHNNTNVDITYNGWGKFSLQQWVATNYSARHTAMEQQTVSRLHMPTMMC
jgi:hypothetical protein